MHPPIKNSFWKNDGLEIAVLDCKHHAFPKHFHDEYVLGVNLIGGESIWVDGQSFDVDLDYITLYNPGEIQSSEPTAEDWKFVSIYFDEEYIKNLFGEDERVIFDESVIHSSLFASSFRHGALECMRYHNNKQEIHEYISMLCDGLLRKQILTSSRSSKRETKVEKISNYLMDNIDADINMRDLSNEFFLTPVQMIRMFKKDKGLAPFQWQKIQKLHRIKQEIANGESILTLSFKYGFSDQPHMSRHFKRLFGITPGLYRNLLK